MSDFDASDPSKTLTTTLAVPVNTPASFSAFEAGVLAQLSVLFATIITGTETDARSISMTPLGWVE